MGGLSIIDSFALVATPDGNAINLFGFEGKLESKVSHHGSPNLHFVSSALAASSFRSSFYVVFGHVDRLGWTNFQDI